MLYLADEMFKNRHKTFTVTFGKPIPWQTFDKSKTPAQWAEYVRGLSYINCDKEKKNNYTNEEYGRDY